MALQSVTDIKATSTDSFVDLWETINQLESVLDVANEDFNLMVEESDAGRKAYFRNRAHNLIGAAQALAANLAAATKVR